MFDYSSLSPSTKPAARISQRLRSLIWTIGIAWFASGMIFGVSFIATPAKFLAPSLDLAQALDVGRATFGVMKWFDLGMLAALVISCFHVKKILLWS
jgi:hypothetical protein